jgi:DNA repair exonuclease SbcCD ATPase subunit
MRIIQFHSENVKRVKAIDITPQDDVIILSGLNGEGKTSVLDSIWLALQYRLASKGNPDPLRVGQKNGVVTIDIGDYIVTRRFTPGGTTLEIRKPNGDKVARPQQVLDGLIGELSFDPWEFARKKEKEQREMLADVLYKITQGQLDLANFDARFEEAKEQRKEVKKEFQRLTTLLTQMRPPTQEDPTDEIAVTDLTNAITQAITVQTKTQQLSQRELELNKRIEDLEKELSSARAEKVNVVRQLEDMPEVPDVDFLKGELANIEARNRRAREVQQYNTLRDGLKVVGDESTRLKDLMELISIEKAEALEKSPLPVKNLRITEEGIKIVNEEDKEVPFCQASAAQQLRVSLAIAMAANPKLRVIRIADGSLLDDISMGVVRSMAKDKDFQVWIEYASRNDQDRMGVYIEDGSVVEVS